MFFVEIYWKLGEYKTEYVKSQTRIEASRLVLNPTNE